MNIDSLDSISYKIIWAYINILPFIALAALVLGYKVTIRKQKKTIENTKTKLITKTAWIFVFSTVLFLILRYYIYPYNINHLVILVAVIGLIAFISFCIMAISTVLQLSKKRVE